MSSRRLAEDVGGALRQLRVDHAVAVYSPEEVPERVLEWIDDPSLLTDMDCDDIETLDAYLTKCRMHQGRKSVVMDPVENGLRQPGDQF